MKPKNLKAPFSWDERRPLIQDRIFHVPHYYFSHDAFPFPGWKDDTVFGNDHPVQIEFCSGNGLWIAERAKQYPDINWVAVEIRFDRVRKIWSKIKNENLSNLFVVCADAYTFSLHYVPEHSVSEVYINFPDPWPKDKHIKHRLMKSQFVKELGRILTPGGGVTFVTDDHSYLEETLEVLLDDSEFTPAYSKPYYVTDFQDYGTSYFEKLWKTLGREICYAQFQTAT